jgi:uncharacterized protein YbaR (Trm112 family)
MINRKLVTVKLHTSGRYFSCPDCSRVRQHPPADLNYYVIGYGFCEWCVRWIPIEGGDPLGLARELREQSADVKKKARKRPAKL